MQGNSYLGFWLPWLFSNFLYIESLALLTIFEEIKCSLEMKKCIFHSPRDPKLAWSNDYVTNLAVLTWKRLANYNLRGRCECKTSGSDSISHSFSPRCRIPKQKSHPVPERKGRLSHAERVTQLPGLGMRKWEIISRTSVRNLEMKWRWKLILKLQ